MRFNAHILIGCLLLSSNLSATSLPAKTLQQLQNIEQALHDNNLNQAQTHLAQLQRGLSEETDSLETALYWQFSAQLALLSDDHPSALTALEHALNSNHLTSSQRANLMLQRAQLQLTLGDYAALIGDLKPWLEDYQGPNPGRYWALLANAYLQEEQFQACITALDTAIQLSPEPPLNWYQLLSYALIEDKRYQRALEITHTLLQQQPTATHHWQQLTYIYASLGQFNGALASLQLAHQQGIQLSAQQWQQNASYLQHQQQPYLAAAWLELGLQQKRLTASADLWQQISAAWQQARETDKAIAALQQAAKLSDTGQLAQQLGQLLIEQQDWSAASRALQNAIAQGGLKNTGEVYILLGYSLVQQQAHTQAKHAFRQALNYPKQRQDAESWLAHLDYQAQP